jgi:hypothetical protein
LGPGFRRDDDSGKTLPMITSKILWLAAAALVGFASDLCVSFGPCDAAQIVTVAH